MPALFWNNHFSIGPTLNNWNDNKLKKCFSFWLVLKKKKKIHVKRSGIDIKKWQQVGFPHQTVGSAPLVLLCDVGHVGKNHRESDGENTRHGDHGEIPPGKEQWTTDF